MIKSLQTIQKRDQEPYKVPHSVQDAIPIQRVWKDGTFQVGKEKYSKTFQISDVNYAVASGEAKQKMHKSFQELLNGLEPGVTTKWTIFNRTQSKKAIKENLIPLRGDDLDVLVEDSNRILLEDAKIGNGIVQSKYVTISSYHDSYEDAHRFFQSEANTLQSGLDPLRSKSTELDIKERLRIFYDFFHPGEEEHFRFSMKRKMQRGHSFLDRIVPDSISYHSDHIRIGKRYARVLYLKEYPTILKDRMIGEMCDIGRNLMLSIDMISIPTGEAVKEVNNILLGIATNAAKWTQKQNQNFNWSATVPFDIQQQQEETERLLAKLTKENQQLKLVTVTLIHLADSKKQLDADTTVLLSTGRKYSCEFEVLKYQQREGMDTALPYGLRKIDALRTMITENAATLMPFRAQGIDHTKGIYCGRNKITGNLIFVNRTKLQNGNSLILGVSGSGKSFFAKREIIQHVLRGDCDVIIVDPEREYTALVEALHGEVINISANSPNHINALDMSAEYAKMEGAYKAKADFVTSFCEQMIGSITAEEKSIISRVTMLVCSDYVNRGFTGDAPTLKDFYWGLKDQPEPEARDLALKIELYTEGLLDTFARPTNVNTQNSLLCYDIRDLGNSLKTVGMLVVLDSIYNRIMDNFAKKRYTYVFIDEFYLLLMGKYSADFLFKQWKRARKYYACYTGITQDVDDMLQSHMAQTMLANSELIFLFNQSAYARNTFSRLLGITPEQLSSVANAPTGHGLMLCSGNIAPFVNKFPKDNHLYPLITTKTQDFVVEPEAEDVDEDSDDE